MIETILILVVYFIIGAIPAGFVASEGIDDNGQVYDNSPITLGFFILMAWPIILPAFLSFEVIEILGRIFKKLRND